MHPPKPDCCDPPEPADVTITIEPAPIECVACDTGGKCPTGEKKAIRFCPACKLKLNQHAPSICPQCGVDLMKLLWDEIDRLGRCNESIGRTDAEIINHLNAKIADLTRQVHSLTQERDDLIPLAIAVGDTSMNDVPEAIWKAWQEPENYRQDELVRLREREADLVTQRNQLTRQLAEADKAIAENWTIDEENTRLRAFRDAVYREIYETTNGENAIAYLRLDRWNEIKAGDQLTHGKPPMQDAVGELARLRAFRDAVYQHATENAGAQAELVYIWQSKWDEIKAAEKARTT